MQNHSFWGEACSLWFGFINEATSTLSTIL
jgi:hypothetical protein